MDTHWAQDKASERLKGMIRRLLNVMETKTLDPYFAEEGTGYCGVKRNVASYLKKRNSDHVRKAAGRMQETLDDLIGTLTREIVDR